MNYLKTLIIALLFPVVVNASPWDTQYKQIEQSIRCPQFAAKGCVKDYQTSFREYRKSV